jgi:hypothetical protein
MVLALTAPPVPGAGDALSDDPLGARIVGLAGRLAAATCQWLLLVADFDAREGHVRYALPSTARWLGHYCGLSRRTAAEHVRVARTLAAFPALSSEMKRGRLSYSHVRAIARVAHDGESQLVDDLIDVAMNGSVGQLETVVRGLRTVEGNDSASGAPPESYVSTSWTSESQWRLAARLEPDQGAVVDKALQTLGRVHKVSAADALVAMAEQALAAAAEGGTMPRPLRGHERAAVLIHLDAASVRRATDPANRPDRRPYARTDDGPGLPDAVIRRLLCSGRIRTAVTDGARTLHDLGRSHRVVSERLYRALLYRDRGCCSVPGCGSREGLDAHHVVHWIDGGPTNLANLVLLCEAHHRGHHAGEFSIAPAGRLGFRFRNAAGRELPATVDPTSQLHRSQPVASLSSSVQPHAATSRWKGERLDRPWAIAVIAKRREADALAPDRRATSVACPGQHEGGPP